MRKVHDFFRQRREQAFSEDEIVTDLGVSDGSTAELRHALEALERALAIQKRIVRNSNYYAFWHEMNTETWEEKVAGLTR